MLNASAGAPLRRCKRAAIRTFLACAPPDDTRHLRGAKHASSGALRSALLDAPGFYHVQPRACGTECPDREVGRHSREEGSGQFGEAAEPGKVHI